MLFLDRRKGGDRRSARKTGSSLKTQQDLEKNTNIESLNTSRDNRTNKERRSSIPRRAQERLKVRDNIFARIKSSVEKVGQIIDISKKGIAFSYVDIGERPDRSFILDMVLEDNALNVENVAFVTKSDFENRLPFSSIPMRRRGGQFLNLSQNQSSQIEHFIRNYT